MAVVRTATPISAIIRSIIWVIKWIPVKTVKTTVIRTMPAVVESNIKAPARNTSIPVKSHTVIVVIVTIIRSVIGINRSVPVVVIIYIYILLFWMG
jgi:hypothetical protein